jgi:hypothetical protein
VRVEVRVRPDVADGAGGGDPALAHAAVLARALVSAAVGTGTDQGPARRRLALGLGLLGPVHAAKPGPAFRALVAPVLDAVGPLPRARLPSHAADDAGSGLDGDGIPARPRAKQASRHMRCACPACGYVARTARKWLAEAGPPHCPRHGPMQADTGRTGTATRADVVPATPGTHAATAAAPPRRQPRSRSAQPALTASQNLGATAPDRTLLDFMR